MQSSTKSTITGAAGDKVNWRIPLSDIDLGDEEIGAVNDVLRSRWLSMGPCTDRFEKEFANQFGARQAFGVNNGTAALHIAYRIFGIGPGDEVILPSLTFVATANSVLYCGARPVFADVTGLHNFDISPDDVSEKITNKTKAITVVHYGGYPCEMDSIMEIAQDHNLKVIEDVAHAPGAIYKGRPCGTIGDVGCFSFFANKNLVTGEGGMVLINDDSMAEEVRTIRSHGMTALTWDRHKGHASSYDIVNLGFNYRINEIASSLGLVQLGKLRANNARRGRIAERYMKMLGSVEDLSIPFKDCKHLSAHHIFPVLVSEDISRDKFMIELREMGIQTSIHYPPIHLFSYYRNNLGFTEGMLPVTEDIGKREVTLPLYPSMSNIDTEYVAKCVVDALDNQKKAI